MRDHSAPFELVCQPQQSLKKKAVTHRPSLGTVLQDPHVQDLPADALFWLCPRSDARECGGGEDKRTGPEHGDGRDSARGSAWSTVEVRISRVILEQTKV